MKYVVSTGEHLVEDVLMHFKCHNCEGYGYFRSRDPQEEDPMCLECMGSGVVY